jgi:hypothetical protein
VATIRRAFSSSASIAACRKSSHTLPARLPLLIRWHGKTTSHSYHEEMQVGYFSHVVVVADLPDVFPGPHLIGLHPLINSAKPGMDNGSASTVCTRHGAILSLTFATYAAGWSATIKRSKRAMSEKLS